MMAIKHSEKDEEQVLGLAAEIAVKHQHMGLVKEK